jgi:hypothetical protein
MNHPYLAVGQKVTYVGPDGKSHEATIRQVFNADEASVNFDGGGGIASYSDKSEPNTFHFEHQASPKAEHKKQEAKT